VVFWQVNHVLFYLAVLTSAGAVVGVAGAAVRVLPRTVVWQAVQSVRASA